MGIKVTGDHMDQSTLKLVADIRRAAQFCDSSHMLEGRFDGWQNHTVYGEMVLK